MSAQLSMKAGVGVVQPSLPPIAGDGGAQPLLTDEHRLEMRKRVRALGLWPDGVADITVEYAAFRDDADGVPMQRMGRFVSMKRVQWEETFESGIHAIQIRFCPFKNGNDIIDPVELGVQTIGKVAPWIRGAHRTEFGSVGCVQSVFPKHNDATLCLDLKQSAIYHHGKTAPSAWITEYNTRQLIEGLGYSVDGAWSLPSHLPVNCNKWSFMATFPASLVIDRVLFYHWG